MAWRVLRGFEYLLVSVGRVRWRGGWIVLLLKARMG